MDGGEGKDTAAYYSSKSGVEVNLAKGEGKGGEAEGDKLKDIENVRGSKYDDTLIGDEGDNRLTAESGDDQLSGGAGKDTLSGGAGEDVLKGGEGNDGLFGGAGTDRIEGGEGNDWINGGEGADQLDGGEGKDTAAYYSSKSGVEINLAKGEGKGGEAEGDKLKDIENVRGSKHDDTLIGDEGDNRLTAESGDDKLIGGEGNDTLIGGAGDDVLKGDGVVDASTSLKVENIGKASAGYHNSYGYYTIDEDGNPTVAAA